ncbi:alpha/beta hydrolase [Marivita sp. S6314]|uniref:alpha/beta fold hydrolase n=1 Tax=Marivita sp. S6314 TaxID=2926406 RepID=UPI001FF48A04|nr:alpha/beta hydrolase [Marivita sp. S6314]MCK0150120.1 alpha/beta hydrolase [Marivita sp. S6314]
MSQQDATFDPGLLRHFEVGGIHALERPGTGPAVVFLHGIGSNSDSFQALFNAIPLGARLIAWNAPGYLSSSALDVAFPTARDYARALTGFLDALGLDQVHLVGHSLGTLIAAEFALHAPTRIASLTLAAAAQGYEIPAGQPMPEKVARRLDDLKALGIAAFAETRAPGLVFEPENNPHVVAQVRAGMERINPEGYAQAVRMLASGSLSAMVARLQVKPAFILGAEDRITPMTQTQAAMDAWAKTHGAVPKCLTIPGAGHAVYIQAPEAFAAALQRLIPALNAEAQPFVKG